MDARIEELIRIKAFDLSQQAERAHLDARDHWLEAERLIQSGGLAEDGAAFEGPSTADVGARTPDDNTARDAASGDLSTSDRLAAD